MNIQIYGKKKCFDTGKAERYFKERRIKYQYIDLGRYGMSKGELESVKKAIGLRELLDDKSPLYQEKNLDKITKEEIIKEIILEYPKLFKTPIVRNGKEATLGYAPDEWQKWE